LDLITKLTKYIEDVEKILKIGIAIIDPEQRHRLRKQEDKVRKGSYDQGRWAEGKSFLPI